MEENLATTPKTMDQGSEMSVTDAKTIDMWGIPKRDNNKIILGIADHLRWVDKAEQGEHQLVLQEKINNYIAFIESGEIYTEIPRALGKSPVIRLQVKYELSEQGEMFIDRVAETLAEVVSDSSSRSKWGKKMHHGMTVRSAALRHLPNGRSVH